VLQYNINYCLLLYNTFLYLQVGYKGNSCGYGLASVISKYFSLTRVILEYTHLIKLKLES
jgi:hypothetical protein